MTGASGEASRSGGASSPPHPKNIKQGTQSLKHARFIISLPSFDNQSTVKALGSDERHRGENMPDPALERKPSPVGITA
jgi:hypothetical protein